MKRFLKYIVIVCITAQYFAQPIIVFGASPLSEIANIIIASVRSEESESTFSERIVSETFTAAAKRLGAENTQLFLNVLSETRTN